ncbi:MAG: hypothetical protein Q7L19_00185 [Pseudohongiella sp.]|nr:hypothetical protein [Pseudohongiella sp.]
MEFLLIVAVVVLIWFFVSGTYKKNLQDPEKMESQALEETIVELKREILATNSYDDWTKYERLYHRITKLVVAVIERHKHFTLDVEAKNFEMGLLFKRVERCDSDGIPRRVSAVPYDLNMSYYRPEHLLYACFFLWYGGCVKNIGEVELDKVLMMKIIDYLINDRDYAPAIFFKGMVCKYGLEPFSQCFPSQAKQLLEQAQKQGIGSATIELQHLDLFDGLEGIQSTEIGEQ